MHIQERIYDICELWKWGPEFNKALTSLSKEYNFGLSIYVKDSETIVILGHQNSPQYVYRKDDAGTKCNALFKVYAKTS